MDLRITSTPNPLTSTQLARRVTAPQPGTPKCASNISGVLLRIAATVSPLRTPSCLSAEARRRARVQLSRQLGYVVHGGRTLSRAAQAFIGLLDAQARPVDPAGDSGR